MKKGIRIALFSVLLLAGAATLTWYFIMRREVPAHARCIPKDVIAVLTLNMRELALDRSSDEHLFPEMAGKKLIHKELEPFARAIEKNGGMGLHETADVLAFFYHNGDAAFWGVVASVDDSTLFGKLIREQLPAEYNIRPFSLRGTTLVRFDTTSAVLGWNKDVALFLFPISNHGVSETADQCAKLLTQSEDQSVLANENFREHELVAFDAGIWMQTQPLLSFTKGGKLFRAAFDDVEYLSLGLDFRDGELDIQRVITSDGKNKNIPYNSPILLSCDPKQVMGFLQFPLDLGNDSLFLDSYVDMPPVQLLPLDDEKSLQLSKTFDGSCTMLVHDTFSYNSDYISYDFDDNFDRVETRVSRKENERGFTANFGLKDETQARKLLTEWMANDSIPMNGKTWLLKDGNMPQYMMISDKMLTITNWPQYDGKKRTAPSTWQDLDLFFPVGKYVSTSQIEMLSFFIPQLTEGKKLISENIELATISQPFITGNKRSSEMRLILANKEVNALVQLEELIRKIADAEK